MDGVSIRGRGHRKVSSSPKLLFSLSSSLTYFEVVVIPQSRVHYDVINTGFTQELDPCGAFVAVATHSLPVLDTCLRMIPFQQEISTVA